MKSRFFFLTFCMILPGFVAEGQWVQTNGPYVSNSVISLASSGSILYAGTAGNGLYHSTDSGAHWDAMYYIDTFWVNYYAATIYSLAVADSSVFVAEEVAGGEPGHVIGSYDGGITWSVRDTGLKSVNPRCFTFIGSNILLGGDCGLEEPAYEDQTHSVLRSSDNGGSWTNSDSSLLFKDDVLFNDGFALSFLSSGRYVFAGGQWGINRSTDSGLTWTRPDTENYDLWTQSILALAASSTDLFAATTTSGIFRSTDSGNTWVYSNNGLTNYDMTALATNGNYLFASTGTGGVFLSTDNGTNWTAVNSGLANLDVQSMLIVDSDLYIGTSTSGVWHRSLSDFATAGVAQTAPSTFEVSPNPTSEMLTVHGAPLESQVTVLNMLGQSVLESANPNSPDFTLDLSRLQPGTYCVRVISPSASITKMIVRQ